MKRDSQELIPAVSYIRMSSKKQEDSPERQRELTAELAASKGYRIVREYLDEAKPGEKTSKRKQFLRMIDDAASKRDFVAIIIEKVDRFGRFDSQEAGYYTFPLREAGIWIHACLEGKIDWNSFEGRTAFNVRQDSAHLHNENLAVACTEQRAMNMRAGKTGGNCPYGFDRQFYDSTGKKVDRIPFGKPFERPKGWTVKFVKAKNGTWRVVIRIFDLYLDGYGLRRIAQVLNEEGIGSPKGKRWHANTVGDVLRNERYTGRLIHGDKPTGRKFHIEAGRAVKGPADPKNNPRLRKDGVHDEIIPLAKFEKVKREIARREVNKRQENSSYPLAGILQCGHCEAPMYGTGTGGYRYYQCSNGKATGTCERYSIRADHIEPYVAEKLSEIMFSPRARAKVETAIDKWARAKTTVQRELDRLRKQNDALTRKIENGLDNLAEASRENRPGIDKRICNWRAEQSDIVEQIRRVTESPAGMTPAKRAAEAMRELDRLSSNLQSGEPARVGKVFEAFIEAIPVWFEPYGERYRRITQGEIQWKQILCVAPAIASYCLHYTKNPTRFNRADILGKTIKERIDETLRQLAQIGESPVRTSEIAARLEISTWTVKGHLSAAKAEGRARFVRPGWFPID